MRRCARASQHTQRHGCPKKRVCFAARYAAAFLRLARGCYARCAFSYLCWRAGKHYVHYTCTPPVLAAARPTMCASSIGARIALAAHKRALCLQKLHTHRFNCNPLKLGTAHLSPCARRGELSGPRQARGRPLPGRPTRPFGLSTASEAPPVCGGPQLASQGMGLSS